MSLTKIVPVLGGPIVERALGIEPPQQAPAIALDFGECGVTPHSFVYGRKATGPERLIGGLVSRTPVTAEECEGYYELCHGDYYAWVGKP